MNDDRSIQLDRMRYTKNTSSSRLAYLAIVFDVLFFISIYKSDVGKYYYTILVGASIIYNLVFLLATFLSSEGVKNYQKEYSYVEIVLGVIQIARIWVYPMTAHNAVLQNSPVMGDGQFVYTVICLALSALCLIASAVINLRKSSELSAHIASLEAKKA